MVYDVEIGSACASHARNRETHRDRCKGNNRGRIAQLKSIPLHRFEQRVRRIEWSQGMLLFRDMTQVRERGLPIMPDQLNAEQEQCRIALFEEAVRSLFSSRKTPEEIDFLRTAILQKTSDCAIAARNHLEKKNVE